MTRYEKWLHLRCAGCGTPRVFREADLFSRQSHHLARAGDIVTVTKPCPHCGSSHPFKVRRPPSEVPPLPRSWRLGPLQTQDSDAGGLLN